MNIETENEKQFNFRLTIEKLEKDSRKVSEFIDSYTGSVETEKDKLLSEAVANVYKHVLYLLDVYLGPNWGKKGHNTLD